MKRFKWDKYHKMIGSRIPQGALVEVVKYCYRRRVLVRYQGETILTMLWCLTEV